MKEIMIERSIINQSGSIGSMQLRLKMEDYASSVAKEIEDADIKSYKDIPEPKSLFWQPGDIQVKALYGALEKLRIRVAVK